jgi:hypothetical protein
MTDFGVARGYICPVELIYKVQPLPFEHPGATPQELLEEKYQEKRALRMKRLMAKEVPPLTRS